MNVSVIVSGSWLILLKNETKTSILRKIRKRLCSTETYVDSWSSSAGVHDNFVDEVLLDLNPLHVRTDDAKHNF